MGILTLLLNLLLAVSTVHAYSSLGTQKAAERVLSRIERNFRIDTQSRPVYDSKPWLEPTCLLYWGHCKESQFSMRHTFMEGNVKAWYTTNREHSVVNLGDEPSKLSITSSTAVVSSTTNGWNIGAKLTAGNGGNGGKTTLELSGGYSHHKAEGSTKTRTVFTDATCRSGYECEIQTWTFHTTILGKCMIEPHIKCGNEDVDVCRAEKRGCSQYDAYFNKWCGSAKKKAHNRCIAQAPIYDESGKLMSKLVLVSKRLTDEADHATKRQDSEETIIEFIEKVLF